MRLLLLFTMFAAASPLFGASFVLEHEGKRLDGGEICLFEAGSPDDPLKRWLSFTEVRCSPAGEVTLPRGLWNLFARHTDGFVSPRPLIVVDGNLEKAGSPLQVVKAVTVRYRRMNDPAIRRAVYIEESGAVFPLAADDEQLPVPADSHLFPLALRGSKIVGIGERRRADAGSEPLAAALPAAGLTDVAVGLAPDPKAFEKIDVRGRAPGKIEIAGGARPLPPVNRIDLAFRGEPALALYRRVPAAEGLRVGVNGEGWFGSELPLQPAGIDKPLRIAPVTTLKVNWSTREDVVALAGEIAKAAPCSNLKDMRPMQAPDVRPEGLALILEQCGPTRPNAEGRPTRDCHKYGTVKLDERQLRGTSVIENVPPGTYSLQLGYGDLPFAAKMVEVDRVDDEEEIELAFDRYFGKVTKDGKPVHAAVDLDFRTRAVTDPETGEYLAVSQPRSLPPPAPSQGGRRGSTVFVRYCEEEKVTTVVAEGDRLPNSRFDIELPSNRITVRTIDAASGGGVPEATVTLAALHTGEKRAAHFAGPAGKTDDKGTLVLEDVPNNRELKICGGRSDYLEECADDFVMKGREREILLALKKAIVREGRITPAPVQGQLVWHSADGRITELVRPEADGSFTYKQPHAPGEIVAIVSSNLPLYVFRYQGIPEGARFDITFPPAPVATYEVSAAPSLRERSGWVGMSIGDIVVPGNVMSWHLVRRGVQGRLEYSDPMRVSDILVTGPVSFIFAPDTWARANWQQQDVDVFYVPAARTLRRTPPGSDGKVVIGD